MKLPPLNACHAMLLLFSSITLQAETISFDFSTTSQLTDNFATTFLPASHTLAVSGGQLVHSGTAAGSASWVYDSTPGAPTADSGFQNFTISTNFTLGASTASFGIYFFDGGNRNNSLLALFNINNSGSDDLLRFFSGGSISGGTPGTLFGSATTLSGGGWTSGQTYLATLAVSYLGSGQVQAQLTISDPNGVLTPFSASELFTGVTPTSGEIGFRSTLPSAGASNSFDNIVIQTVPEPSSLALLGAAAWIFRGRRVRRNAL